ncbi:hypothetical protein DR871_003885 [Flavobacterium petrolei]|uniref:Uncharacterized protein n=1 Tax=Flavobacterium petrolei TaxID=2259594 RepID=A0A482TPM2_9FLAO|nr:hypothetical protein [Flavobacterium petrolei]RYJ53197.1 hypothetical protein DR871_003885 [Flavobacterium petrolei]
MENFIKRELAFKRYWLKKMTKYCESVIEKNNVGYKNVEVREVYYFDKESRKPLLWENSGDPYVLISFYAISKKKLDAAVKDFKNGDYSKLQACNIFLRMSPKDAKHIFPGTKGVLACEYFEDDLTGYSFHLK